MRVVFRADASIEIGSGHVMRCLTMADAIREQGGECVFVCRAHPGHMIETIAQKGYETRPLGACTDQAQPNANAEQSCSHAHWLGATWQMDATNTKQALAGDQVFDWMVVDHYGLDARWEQDLRTMCRHMMVVDDLADRPHHCDVLLDQNLGRHPDHYQSLLPQQAQLLIGPEFALLRPEFSQHRSASLARRANSELKRVLVSMGGVDKDNVTGQVLAALAHSSLAWDTKITVIMGMHAPWLNAVRAQAEKMPYSTEVLVGISDMGRLMMHSDLAIGAAGGTAWERCCLGLPSGIFVLADNQRAGATALQQVGAARLMQQGGDVALFVRELLQSRKNVALQDMSRAAASITDGEGAARVITSLMELSHG